MRVKEIRKNPLFLCPYFRSRGRCGVLRRGMCGVSLKKYIFAKTLDTMKVLLINGSPHREGNTFIALSEVARTLESEGVQAEIVHIGTKAVQGCIACGKCAELGHCVFSDALYTTVREKLADADGIVVGSPVYYAGPNGSLCALLDRVFYSCCLLYTSPSPRDS